MNFEDFLKSIPKIKNIPLPAEASQFKMMPGYRMSFIDAYKKSMAQAKQSAVLALFYPDMEYQTKLALILRKTYKGVHSAQIGFPGGKMERTDRDLMDTALRETHEEIGVLPQNIRVVKTLTQVYIPPSNFSVQPFMGFTDSLPRFTLQEEEVEALLQVPLTDFLDDTKIIQAKVQTSFHTTALVPAFDLQGHVVWGATSMMLSEVKDMLKVVL